MISEHSTVPFTDGATMTRYSPTLPGAISREVAPVLDPHDPMASARRLLADKFTIGGERSLQRYRGGFYKYCTSSYRAIDDDTMRAEIWAYLDAALKPAGEAFARFKPTKLRVADVFAALESLCNLDSMFNPPCWVTNNLALGPADEYVPVANGLLHLPTGKLIASSPTYFAINGCYVLFDPAAPNPKDWLKFLNDVFGDDNLSSELLQEWMGYCLSADTSQHKIMLMAGPPRSGKSTIANILTALLGSSNVAGLAMSSFSEGFGLEPLIGKNLAISGDARIGGRTDQSAIVERLLSISGEDTQTINRKFRHSWTGRLRTRLMMLSNELPRLSDNSGALARRFLVLLTSKSFYGAEDHTLETRLQSELPGIFNWALEGYQRLRSRGRFVQPQSGLEAIQEVEELASPIKVFIAEECNLRGEVQITDLYAIFVRWCKDNGHEAGSKLTFGRNLKTAVPGLNQSQMRIDGARQRVYAGISLKLGSGS